MPGTATPRGKKKFLDDEQLQKALGTSGRCLEGDTLSFDQYVQTHDLMKTPKSKQDELYRAYFESRKKQELLFDVLKEQKSFKSVAQLQQAVDARIVNQTKSPYKTRRVASLGQVQITDADLDLYNDRASLISSGAIPQASPLAQPKSPTGGETRSPVSPRPIVTSPKNAGTGVNRSNWSEGIGQGTLMVPFLLLVCPFLCQLLAYITSPEAKAAGVQTAGLTGLLGWASGCTTHFQECFQSLLDVGLSVRPTFLAIQFVAGFAGLALLLDALPGPDAEGPPTGTGHVPIYRDNGLYFCIAFCSLFAFGSLGLGWFDFGIVYDQFPGIVATLNIVGLVLALFLTIKGLYFPSTADSGSTGSILVDYFWGTELYPRVWGVDIKRFINCRFAMTLWMLSGLSFCYKSYKMRGDVLDYGLFFSALSQFIYLVKFFIWEIGYLRSIDIISDRAGFNIQWGCLVWVPSIYTMHTRFLVQNPSDLSPRTALILFVISMLGVYFNFLADRQRQLFREVGPDKMMILGKRPVYVEATYVCHVNGKQVQKQSNLLASGWWGPARHFHYVFELTAAWCWCLLAHPAKNGIIVLIYAIFLTILLFHRAKRDEVKCHLKYGEDFKKFCAIVPYLIFPGVW
jgi:7-dehydrocholesterol reductase